MYAVFLTNRKDYEAVLLSLGEAKVRYSGIWCEVFWYVGSLRYGFQGKTVGVSEEVLAFDAKRGRGC